MLLLWYNEGNALCKNQKMKVIASTLKKGLQGPKNAIAALKPSDQRIGEIIANTRGWLKPTVGDAVGIATSIGGLVYSLLNE